MTELLSRRGALGGIALALAVALPGCAGMHELTADVSSYGNWPSGRAPGAYIFERLPSQQQDPQGQDRLEAAAQPALAQAGFRRADRPEQADSVVQVSLQQTTIRVYDGYGPYGGYGPFGRFGFGGGFWGGGPRVGVGIGISAEPPVTRMQVNVLIRDKRSSQVLYETHAVRQQNGGADETLLAPMFEAALKDFPLPAVSPRQVTVPLPERP